MESKYKVTYISNVAEGKDKFANDPHKSVANTLSKLISSEKNIKHPIIGIEGEWGSGKTNVLKMLEKNLAKEYAATMITEKFEFFTYDTWGYQEDLTRRSFLETLIGQLSNPQKSICSDIDWDEEKDNLSARKTNRTIKKFPQLKFFYVILLLIPAVIFIIDICEDLFGYNNNAWLTYIQLKGCVSLGLLVWALYEIGLTFIKEYKIVAKDNTYCISCEEMNSNVEDCKPKYTWKNIQKTFGRLAYFFQGSEIDSREKENVIDDEPSVCRFQDIFTRIVSKIKPGTSIVIVFDNMDRLCEPEKLMSIWTSIHTFFAERDYNNKVWVIVPYDKTQLSLLFDRDSKKTTSHTKGDENQEGRETQLTRTTEFLNKTFFTTFRIPTPILSTWKKYLYELLDIAFEPCLSEKDKHLLSVIFSKSIDITRIKPREIIAYVNNLVSLYNQHSSKDIPIAYLALYSQYKDVIIEDPINSILNFKSYESFVGLFDDENSLRSNVGALFYNIDKDEAIEIILLNEIESLLKSNLKNEQFKERVEKLSATPQFKHYSESVLLSINNLEEYNLKSISNFLEHIGDQIDTSTRNHIWRKFQEVKTNTPEFKTITPWLKYILTASTLTTANKLVKGILANITPTTENKNKFKDYYLHLLALLQIKDSRTELVVAPEGYVCNVDEMKDLYSYLKSNKLLLKFDSLNIYVDEDGYSKHINTPANNSYEYYKPELLNEIELLEFLISKDYDKTEIKSYNDSIQPKLTTNSSAPVCEIAYLINRIINTKIEKVPVNTYSIYSNWANSFNSGNDIVASMLFMLKNKHDNAYSSQSSQIQSVLQSYSSSDIEGLYSVYSSYMTYGELIELAIEHQGKLPIINELISTITRKGSGTLNTTKIFESLSKINEFIFKDQSLEDFLLNFNRYSDEYKLSSNNIFNISPLWYSYISPSYVNQYMSFRHIIDIANQTFDQYKDSEWACLFNKENNAHAILNSLISSGVVDSTVYKSQNINAGVEIAFQKYMNEKDSDFDKVRFDEFYLIATKAVKDKLITQIYDQIKGPTNITIDKMEYFISYLFDDSKRITQATYKQDIFDSYLMRIFEDSDINFLIKFIETNTDKLLDFVNNSDEERRQLLTTCLYLWVDENKEHPQINTIEKFAMSAKLERPKAETTEKME